MSLDFALKDFYRKRSQTFPYVFIIALIIALAEFMIYFSTLFGFNMILQLNFLSPENYDNEYYLSGAFNVVYSQFTTLLNSLMVILAIAATVIVTTTLIVSKKRDIAIMKSLGTMPERLYLYYLLEAYIIFLIGFLLGFIFGLSAFGILSLFLTLMGYAIQFQFDILFTSLLFSITSIGIYLVSGYSLKKIGSQNIIKSFSKDIPYEYDASKRPTIIPRWMSSFGHNFKMAVLNSLRRKGEFKRFMVVFTLILLIIFTLGLGVLVLNNSAQHWIKNSQGENILVIGHEDLVETYDLMYQMFSDPRVTLDPDKKNFLNDSYLFSSDDVRDIANLSGIQQVQERLIQFCEVKELDGIRYSEGEGSSAGYSLVGSDREDNIPLIGVDPNNIINNYEIEGDFFNEDNSYDKMVVGDGLAYNFFDFPLSQSLQLTDYGRKFHVSGIIMDTFYSGYAGYISLDILQQEFGLENDQINVMLVVMNEGSLVALNELEQWVSERLGQKFIVHDLSSTFTQNVNHVVNLSYAFMAIIALMTYIGILSLYNYQKAGIMEKAKDLIIMKAVGAKNSSIRKILFLEALFIIVPSLMLCAGLSMIFNSLFLIDKVYLPSLVVPFLLMLVIFLTLLLSNYLSLSPIIKRINQYTIKDFEMFG